MPRLSDSMLEGTIVRWLKADGELVAAGEDLVEIETDKATLTHAADAGGALAIIARPGDSVAVGDVIARLGSRRLEASPVARRVARDLGVDLGGLTGTGPGGRIVRADVEAAVVGNDAPPASEGIELTTLQQTVARRMTQSRAEVPDFTVRARVAMDAAVAWREEVRRGSAEGAPVPTFNDLVVKAAALALREHPRVNGAYRDGRWHLSPAVHVGFAVAADAALVVVTLRDADRRPLGELAGEARALAQRARAGRATPDELTGATFTVSNLGMLGVASVDPIVNPPHAAILGVGAVRAVPVVRDGAVVPGRELELSLVCDHRIVYGADAAAFLATVTRRLEHPATLAV